MKKLIAALLLSTVLFSCTKGENAGKPSATEGIIRYTNNSTNPYDIYLDGSSVGSIDGKKYFEKKVNVGTHTVKAIQAAGYVLYPTERTATITLTSKQEKEFVFP